MFYNLVRLVYIYIPENQILSNRMKESATMTIKAKSAVALSLLILLFSAVSFAQKMDMDISGQCRNYDVTLIVNDLEEGCYDLKIDMTCPEGRGEIYDPREGWKSSYYYIDEAFCIGKEIAIISTWGKLPGINYLIYNERKSIKNKIKIF